MNCCGVVFTREKGKKGLIDVGWEKAISSGNGGVLLLGKGLFSLDTITPYRP